MIRTPRPRRVDDCNHPHAAPRRSLPGRGRSRGARALVVVVLAALLAAVPAFAADWYVKPGGSDGNDGQSWATAFATIQKAVTSAIQLGGYEIWVAEGTYALSASIVIPSVGTKIPLKLYGGFADGDLTLDDRNWVEHLTVIDGGGVVESVIVVNNYVDLIDGFTITGGRAGSMGTGGGIDIRGCGSAAPQPVLRNLVIRGNGGDTSHPPSYYEGGGIYIADCSPWIANVSFSNNLAWGHGGAVFARDTDDTTIDTYPTIVNSTFTGNHADVNGGAVGVYRGTLTVANSILWGDWAGDGVTNEVFGGTLVVTSSDVDQDGYAGTNGNIDEDPIMTGVGRFHLRDGSPCIDSGADGQVPSFLTTDFDGDDRFLDGATGAPGGTVDMGADEFDPNAVAGVYYVDWENGNDGYSGTSWGTAFATIQRAITEAVSDAEIWIRQGTYSLTSSITLGPANDDLAFYGGFVGTETLRSQRSSNASLTIIDGQNSCSCFTFNGLDTSHIDNVVIDALTLIHGSPAALYIWYADGTQVNGCRFTDSTADGAIWVGSGDLTVDRSFFSGNVGHDEAGAIHMGGGSDRLTVTDSVFIGNSAEDLTYMTSGCGGAIRAGTGTIERSLFFGNTAARSGGAVYNYAGYGEGLVVRNCVFSGNQAGLDYFQGNGGATWGPMDIVNCSMSGNSSESGSGAGGAQSPNTVTNSILWNNDSVEYTLNTNLNCALGRVLYSDVGDASYAVAETCTTPYGSINADPAFTDADGPDATVGTSDDDLSVQAGSPAIDAGDSTALPFGSTDAVGEERHIDDPAVTDSGYGPPPAIDMGAYERQASTPGETYDLTMAVNGSGSTVPTVGVHTYDRNALVQVQAIPAASWLFTGWTGWVADPASATTTITMAWDRSVTANFKQVQTLEVGIQGTGTGSVSSAPAGIDCPDVCDAIFDHGTTVTLSASPDPGTVFDGWMGGGCLGTGDCQLTMTDYAAVDGLFNLEGTCGLGDNVTLEDFTVTWDQAFEACSSLTVGSGFVIEAPADVVFRAGNDVVLTDGFFVGEGATFRIEISPDVGERAIEVTKVADPTTAYEGDPITYTISVENTGCVDLTEVSVVDGKCTAAPAYQSGDDGDSKLEPAEVWVYECSGPAEANNFVNTATATFQDIFGQEVSDSGQATVTVDIAACVGNRYADMGDGTILDCNTDLLWLKDASCADLAGTDTAGRGDWTTAVAAAAALANGTCGLTDGSAAGDWRLPAMAEVCGSWPGSFVWETGICEAAVGLIDDAYLYPMVTNTAGDAQWSEGNPFSGVKSNMYWSSDTYSTSDSWVADLGSISISYYSDTTDYIYIWPVRPR